MAYYEQLCKAKEVVVGTMIVGRYGNGAASWWWQARMAIKQRDSFAG